MGLYSWGCNSFGQLALQRTKSRDGNEVDGENDKTVPTLVQLDITQNVMKVVSGWMHTIIITDEKIAYSCGFNEHGQLGRSFEKSFDIAPVAHLESERILDASCGESHTLLLNDKGQVFAFGQNSSGQLGIGSEQTFYASPLLVEKISIGLEITAISCGKQHSLALSAGGQVYSWGSNNYGQLGIGNKSEKIMKPKVISSLPGCPIIQICAGGYHSFALTVSGTLFSWGKNSYGQLGLGHTNDALHPTRVKLLLQDQSVRFITCGEEHTMALTSAGKVLTFGCGASGQLGHDSFNDEFVPKMVIDLVGSFITNISCGRKHSLCYSSSSGNLYSFGLNVKGQLGVSSYQKYNTPVKLNRFWRSFSKTDFLGISSEEKDLYFDSQLEDFITELDKNKTEDYSDSPEVFLQVIGGGLNSFLVTCPIEEPRLPTYNNLLKTKCLYMLTRGIVEQMTSNLKKGSQNLTEWNRINHYLSTAFTNQSCLNASFLSKKDHETPSKKSHGLHLMAIHVSIGKLWEIEACKEIVKRSLANSMLPSLQSNPADIECLRVYIIIPEILNLMNAEEMLPLAVVFAEAIHHLQQAAQKILLSWWSTFPATFLERIVKCYKSTILELFPKHRHEAFHQGILTGLSMCLKVLKIIYGVSESKGEVLIYSTFYIPGLMEKIDIRKDFVSWIENPDGFSFCHYPFVFEIKEKALMMEFDADLQMRYMVGRAQMFNLTSWASGNIEHPQNPFLVLQIRRDHLVQDTLNNILAQHMIDFKKPLKVKFTHEDAEDAGGVKKEFFLLLMKDLLDPKYGMFDFFKESGCVWFKSSSFEGPDMFMLIGVICGLAIYNSIIVDVPFPLCLYKKLLDRQLALDDYRDLEPTIYWGLQNMLDYTEDDFNDIYDMNFQVIETLYGENKVMDLKENGANISVTQENKEEYVKCFLDYKLHRSVQREFEAFKDGFLRVCGGKVFHFLHPQELMELVVGSQDYDFAELEKVTEYKGDYYRQHPVIVNFWDVFHSLDLDLKKKFLAFLTGTTKVSVLGIKHMKFIIQPVAGGEDGTHLPVAHTCFNLLDLPRYPNIETMTTKLHQAIENSEGFGLI